MQNKSTNTHSVGERQWKSQATPSAGKEVQQLQSDHIPASGVTIWQYLVELNVGMLNSPERLMEYVCLPGGMHKQVHSSMIHKSPSTLSIYEW